MNQLAHLIAQIRNTVVNLEHDRRCAAVAVAPEHRITWLRSAEHCLREGRKLVARADKIVAKQKAKGGAR